jgi:hypothetical protein
MANMHKVGKHLTKIFTVNGVTSVRYVNTDVVKFSADKIWLRNGGWLTVTTKRRMNQAAAQFDLGYRVYAERGDWWCHFEVGNADNAYMFENGEIVLDRKTGMMITEEQ